MESYRKLRILDLSEGKVRVLGTVTRAWRPGKLVQVILLDDGTGEIRAKIFGENQERFKVGDIVEIFGEIREDEKGKYVFCERIFKRDIYYELSRLLEIKKILGRKEEEVPEEEPVEYIVRKLEKDGFIELEDLKRKFRGREEEIERLIEEFKNEGIIFEERPGVFRRL